MTTSNKTPSVQTYKLLIYQRALHPELFGIQGRRTVGRADYEAEAWAIPGGHVVRFQLNGHCVTEAVTDQDQQLPDRGLIEAVPCLGERDIEHKVQETINYVTSVQTELLSDNLYSATLREMREFANESEAMRCEWTDAEGAANLSVVDLQRYKRELHLQTYHLIGSAAFVLRTQSIFEIL